MKMLGQDIHTQAEFDQFYQEEFKQLKQNVEHTVKMQELNDLLKDHEIRINRKFKILSFVFVGFVVSAATFLAFFH